MDNIDQIVKQYMSRRSTAGADRGVFVPDQELWHGFFDNSLPEQELAQMTVYLLKDREAREFALKTRRILAEAASATNSAPKAWVDETKKSLSSKLAKPKKKQIYWLWYALSIAAFALSFLMPRYYMQFLVLTALAGIKGIVDQRQAKMQILIYQVLESGKTVDSNRLKQMGIKQ